MNRMHYIFLTIFIVNVYCFAEAAAQDIVIARGQLVSPARSLPRLDTATYLITEIGRGQAAKLPTRLYFRAGTTDGPLPLDAILLLQGPSISEAKTEYNSYQVLSLEAGRGILPFSDGLWKSLLSKTDEELVDTPAENQISDKQACKILGLYLVDRYENPQFIYYYPCRRVPFGWVVSALFTQKGGMLRLSVQVGDSGNVWPSRESPSLVRVFRGAELSAVLTAETADKYVAEYHHNTPSEEWPRRVLDSSSSESEGFSSSNGIGQGPGVMGK